MKSLIVLDNEAVQAMGSPAHPKHQRVLSLVQVVAQRKRRAAEVALAVPTTVRAQAGWDRTVAAWALANRLRVADEAHIVVDSDVCRSCTTKACVTACPANLFVPTADGGVLFNYEQCFECGTCYLVCNHEGAISWSYPLGGFGVVFRHS